MDAEWGGAGAAPPPGASTLLPQTRDDFRVERVALHSADNRSNVPLRAGAAPRMAVGADVSLAKAAATLEWDLASEDAKAACEEAEYVERVLLRTGRCIAGTDHFPCLCLRLFGLTNLVRPGFFSLQD